MKTSPGLFVFVKTNERNNLCLACHTWHGVLCTMKEERSGPYLLPPLQLTKDPLKALVHVVKLEKKKTELPSQLSDTPQSAGKDTVTRCCFSLQGKESVSTISPIITKSQHESLKRGKFKPSRPLQVQVLIGPLNKDGAAPSRRPSSNATWREALYSASV